MCGDDVLSPTRQCGCGAGMTDGHGPHGGWEDVQGRVREGECVGGRARRDGAAGGFIIWIDGDGTDDRWSAIWLGGRESGGNGRCEGTDGEGEEEIEVGSGTSAHVHDEDVPSGSVLLCVTEEEKTNSTEREGTGGARALDAVDEEERPQHHALLAVDISADGGMKNITLHVGTPRIATWTCGDETLRHVLQLEKELRERRLRLVEDRIEQRYFHGCRAPIWCHHRDFPLDGKHVMYYISS